MLLVSVSRWGLGSITSVAGNAQVGCWLNLSSSGPRKWEKLGAGRVITHKDGREEDVSFPATEIVSTFFLSLSHGLLRFISFIFIVN